MGLHYAGGGTSLTALNNAFVGVPDAVTVAELYVDPTHGNDSNTGLSWAAAKATIAAAVTAANGSGVVRLARGVHNVTSTLVIPQGVKLQGFGPLLSQESEVVWTGADDGSYVIRTASNTSGADWTQGRMSGFLVRPNATKPGGGAYTNLNGLDCRNMQNGSRIADVQVKNFPGIGVKADWQNTGLPADGFPGFVTFERVWSSGCNVNWHVYGGFTSVFFNMCAGDVSSNTTDVFVLDGRTGGTLGGRGANYIFLGFKSEDNGSPTGAGADPNYFTINADFAVAFDGCSGKKGAPGTKPWINYTATPSSQNAVTGGIPLGIRNSHTSNIPVMVKGPDGTTWLAPKVGSGGESFQVAWWSGQAQAPKKWTGTHSGLAADGLSIAGANAASPTLDVVPAAGQTAAVQQVSSALVSDTAANASTADTGQTITFSSGTWSRSGSTRYNTAASADARAYLNAGVADYTLRGTVLLSSGVGKAGFMFRHVDGSNHLRVMLLSSGSIQVQSMNAGVQTTLASVSDASIVPGGTYTVDVVTSGTSVIVKLNGSTKASITLTGSDASTFTTPTNVGYRQDASGSGDDGGSRLGPLYLFAPVFRVTAAGTTQIWSGGSWASVTPGGSVAAHAATHARGGTDQVTPQALGAAPARVSSSAALMSETVPRWGVTTVTPTAGVVYLARISLKAGTYSTVSFCPTAAGVTVANAFFGLYDVTSLALLATSSSAVTAMQSTGVQTVAMSYTVPADGDYYLAMLVGTAGTMPTIVVSGTGLAGLATYTPIIAHRHNTTGLTALPATAVLMTSPSGIILPWARYE